MILELNTLEYCLTGNDMADNDKAEKSRVDKPEKPSGGEPVKNLENEVTSDVLQEKESSEKVKFSATVKNLSSKSMKQLSKWNNESFLYAFDRQLISFGIRLLLFLPGFAILAYFGAWAYSSSSPSWWVDFIEPTIGQSFSTILVALVFVILLGYILALALHRHRVNLTIKTFEEQVKSAQSKHLSIKSLHGYEPLEDSIKRSVTKHFFSLVCALLAIFSLSAIAFYGIQTDMGKYCLALSFSLTVLSVGQHVSTRSSSFNMAERTGLLNAYNSPIHPSTLDMVFSDLVKSQLDPLLKSEYEVFTRELESHVKRGVDPRFAREKMMMTLYKHSKGLDLSSVESEFSEVFTKAGVELVRTHEIFTIEEWLLIIDHLELRCPAFFRMIGRIEEDLASGRKSINDDIIFEVDMENVVHGKANLFTYMHNLSDEPRTVVLRVQSPDFRPHDIAMTYLLQPGEEKVWPDTGVPLAQSGNQDILAIMSALLRDGTVAWQTLLPERFGEATVSVRLEEVNGELLVGSQMNVRIRSVFKERIRSASSVVFNMIGIIGTLISASLLTYIIV